MGSVQRGKVTGTRGVRRKHRIMYVLYLMGWVACRHVSGDNGRGTCNTQSHYQGGLADYKWWVTITLNHKCSRASHKPVSIETKYD